MKKILCLAFVLVLSLFSVSCSVAPRGELASEDRIEAYFEDREILEAISYKFSYKSSYECQDSSIKEVEKVRADGAFNYDDDLYLKSFEYSVREKTKNYEYTSFGRIKTTTTKKEKAKAIIKENDELLFVDYKLKVRSEFYREDLDLKTTDGGEYFELIYEIFSLDGLIEFILDAAFEGYAFIKGDDMTIIFATDYSKTTIEIDCRNCDFKSIKITNEDSYGEEVLKIKTCRPVNISIPKDRDKYE